MKILTLLLALFLFSGISAQRTGLYNGTENLTQDDLKAVLHQIVRNHVPHSYDMAKEILKESDADPTTPGNVIMVYTGRSQDGDSYGTAGNDLQREHVWAKSHGDFGEDPPTGSDAHNLKPADASVNASRSNLDFDWGGTPHSEATDCSYDSDSWEPRDEVKGDVARIIFYMATRYEGTSGELDLEPADYVNTYPYSIHGKLSTLLEWNNLDPVDEFEMNRNNMIEKWQKNRNPFIDNPHFANLIWNDGTLPVITFSNFNISPAFPIYTDNPTISVNISSSAGAISSAILYWGTTLGNINNAVNMSGTGTFTANILAQAQNTRVFYKIVASDGTNSQTSIMYSYLVPEYFSGSVTSIRAIQGETTSSPYADQNVSTTGVVTGVFPTGYFIQDGYGPWSGLYIYDSYNTPMLGDSIVVSGLITEYFGMTEMKNISASYLCGENMNLPPLTVIQAGEAAEQYESVLVGVVGANCTDADAGYGMWTINDASGSVFVHNNTSYSYTPTIGQQYTVTGPLNYTFGEFKIELRTSADVQLGLGIEESANNGLIVYPNPANDLLFLDSNEIIFIKVEIFDINGKKLSLDFNKETKSINIESLKPGLYNIKLESDKSIYYSKFVKQ
ncbi:MAG: endonuclease [Bacteroidales bacterium]|nr:endonuclease [Bacteroidales bacterium]